MEMMNKKRNELLSLLLSSPGLRLGSVKTHLQLYLYIYIAIDRDTDIYLWILQMILKWNCIVRLQAKVYVGWYNTFPCLCEYNCFQRIISLINTWHWGTLSNISMSSAGTCSHIWHRTYNVELRYQVGKICKFILFKCFFKKAEPTFMLKAWALHILKKLKT